MTATTEDLPKLDLRYEQVTCSRCGKRYQCRPSADYYNATSAHDGICIGCLKAQHQLDDTPTVIVTIDPTATRWFLSRHALDRMAVMDLVRADVVDILREPDVDYCSKGDRRVAVRGDLAVVYEGDTVITVLLHRQEQWDRTEDKPR